MNPIDYYFRMTFGKLATFEGISTVLNIILLLYKNVFHVHTANPHCGSSN
jgi:hypothetical protein